ncbi:hypothetical protein MU516_07105 [Paracoccus sp. YLB-12]|uniref:Uncharacterized protein n=1 Tax=Paracoccus maritimus TaxID=2933292 RepID=A0ABT2K7X5_9RHOB|nr:hypothetical protein [Paracoccus sp. YLB-12]MCT4332634.1 hypothetical protein [Paracoccus sp. YLB-12]
MADKILIETAEGLVFDLLSANENLTMAEREKLVRENFEDLIGLWREANELPEADAA